MDLQSYGRSELQRARPSRVRWLSTGVVAGGTFVFFFHAVVVMMVLVGIVSVAGVGLYSLFHD